MRLTIPAAAVIAFTLCTQAAPAVAEPVSPWAKEASSALRLVDAGAAREAGSRLAAITIRLSPGWKTYWRQPGASGVPPRFDFSGSSNVAEAHVVFPAPERADDEDGVTNVYHGVVTLPVTVKPRDASVPVDLKLVADYGVCEKVCVPVRSEAALELKPGGDGAGPAGDEAREAAAAAPVPSALGAKAELAVESVRRASARGEPVALEILAAAPEGADQPELFAETGEGDYAPAPEAEGEANNGKARFKMTFDEPELPKSGLKLTLSAGGRAVETAVALDDIAPAP